MKIFTLDEARALLPVAETYVPQTPSGFTPLVAAPRLARRIGACNLYIKNDAVCAPTLSYDSPNMFSMTS